MDRTESEVTETGDLLQKLQVSQQEIFETTAMAVALWESIAEWPMRYVFKIFEDIENE